LVRVLEGEILDVVVDLRKITFGKHFSVLLSAENNKQLMVHFRSRLRGFERQHQ
jgi:dTDP-4-dehydrorhamnose 3,5-epimerase